MEEILELKQLLLQGDIKGALVIAEEIAEMSKKDIINNIYSFAVILLLHLIKQKVENRTTRSWDTSIRNSLRNIKRLNKRLQSNGCYLNLEELEETLIEAYSSALDGAALEILEGIYEAQQLKTMVKEDDIIANALALITSSEFPENTQ
ncbi:DUF29 family protein [Argonema antarcticum]|uniref:DUF29 family protein n=1 Tax=Argonema antarcticum TaxID=2942763 RepID=UPI0020133E6E|nr:DUF29 family protein [Argonema antarcticum]MCL1473557.1 DUF29 domain-containing protein [Argonema antarcticum A004/B2]